MESLESKLNPIEIFQRSKDFIDYKMGSLGATIMGTPVFLINLNHGPVPASVAGLKQAAYTFILGGFFTKMCERISTSIENPYLARAAGIGIPAAITIGLTYDLHLIKGTPDPAESTLPTIILAPTGFTYWSNRKIKQAAQEITG